MAKLKTNNRPQERFNALFGREFIVKKAYGKLVFCEFHRRTNKNPTKAQLKTQNRFRKAVQYAKKIDQNPEKRQAYIKKLGHGKSVFSLAMKEFFEKERD